MNAEETTTAQAETTHDAKGRFMPGNPGGPGNPFARQTAALRQALLDAITPQDMQAIAAKLIEQAKDGNIQAAKLLFTYAIGKPQPAPEPDRMDANEWDVYRETVPMKKESAPVVNAGLPEFHLQLARMMRPIISEMQRDQVHELFSEDPKEREARLEREADEEEQEIKAWMESPEGLAFAAEIRGESPSPKGSNGQAPPSANGGKRSARPSANGNNGGGHPSRNGQMPPRAEPRPV